jgi:hypothetical protein
MGWPKGKPRPANSGRKPGTRNRRQAAELAQARAAIAEARAGGVKLGKEICSDFANIFARLALEVRPVTEFERKCGVRENPKANIEQFKELSNILLHWVVALMPYQSAKFQSIRVDIGELDSGDVEEVGALEQLEKLLDAYAEAQRNTIESQATPALPPIQPAQPEPASIEKTPDNT